MEVAESVSVSGIPIDHLPQKRGSLNLRIESRRWYVYRSMKDSTVVETWRRKSFLLNRDGKVLCFQALAETQAAKTSAYGSRAYDDSSLRQRRDLENNQDEARPAKDMRGQEM